MHNHDLGQTEALGRQLACTAKVKPMNFLTYIKKYSVNAYGYLLIDLGPKTPEDLQLGTNIFGVTPCETVYQW